MCRARAFALSQEFVEGNDWIKQAADSMFSSAPRVLFSRSRIPVNAASKFFGATGAIVLLHHQSAKMSESSDAKTSFSPKVLYTQYNMDSRYKIPVPAMGCFD